MFAILNMWNYKRDEARRHVDDMKDDSNTMVQVILSLCARACLRELLAACRVEKKG